MEIIKTGNNSMKPKNYSRKSLICTCDCQVVSSESTPRVLLDNVVVKYKVKPIKGNKYTHGISKNEFKDSRWGTTYYSYWGEFDGIVELPDLFKKLNDDEFSIKTAFFTRDNRQMPFVSEIEVYNTEKYNILKLKTQRNKKLKNIIKNE